jgi:thiamine-phosphate pyrophosphorylase
VTGSPAHAHGIERLRHAGVYLVTGEPLSNGRTTLSIVAAALDAGIRLVQLREKDLPRAALTDLAHEIRAITRAADSLMIVNDDVEIAIAVEADGVHLGRGDLPIEDARRLAPDLIIGASAHSADEALEAEQRGASYVNIGPIYPTRTKEWSKDFLGPDAVRAVTDVVRIPVTCMGGIKLPHIPGLVAAGAQVIAVVTAITAADDPGAAARELLTVFREARGG